jgi:plasmid rolling circle replication initiator protein Rep
MARGLAVAGLLKESVRLRECAEALFFCLLADDFGELHWRLISAPFCKYRHCPICQWRRSLRNKGIIMTALPAILEQHPSARFVMLTITVKNCPVDELRRTIHDMNGSWKRLMQRKDWPALGWIRGVEVTLGKDGPLQAHPHYHALLMLPASYFGKGYVPAHEWVRRIREAFRLDYDPVCDIRVVRVKAGREGLAEGTDTRLLAVISAVSEVVKYATKASDMLSGGPEWLATYIDQVRSLKFLTSGGVLKGIIKPVKRPEDENLVNVGDGNDEHGKEIAKLVFHWRTKHQRYARKR